MGNGALDVKSWMALSIHVLQLPANWPEIGFKVEAQLPTLPQNVGVVQVALAGV